MDSPRFPSHLPETGRERDRSREEVGLPVCGKRVILQ